jgi:hypothetical protein
VDLWPSLFSAQFKHARSGQILYSSVSVVTVSACAVSMQCVHLSTVLSTDVEQKMWRSKGTRNHCRRFKSTAQNFIDVCHIDGSRRSKCIRKPFVGCLNRLLPQIQRMFYHRCWSYFINASWLSIVLCMQPDRIVVCVNTERDIFARCVDLENEIIKLTSFLRQNISTIHRLFVCFCRESCLSYLFDVCHWSATDA